MNERFLRVRNFEKFQHYNLKNLKGDPHPSWIKIYYKLLHDRRFYRLPDAQKFHVVGFFLLASQHDNKLPFDLDWIQDEMNATDKIDLQAMLDSRFIEWIEPNGPSTPSLKEITDKAKTEIAPTLVQPGLSPLNGRESILGLEQIREEERRREQTKALTRLLSDGFERLWQRYPVKDGRKDAERHFSASVKTEQDLSDIDVALTNYLKHIGLNEWKRPKNGKTWFNNWRDWVKWKEPVAVKTRMPL